jgi:hypothetical protein
VEVVKAMTVKRSGANMPKITWDCIYESAIRTLPESVGLAERLAREDGGILRNPREMRRSGHKGLQEMMLLDPEAFAHIRQKEETLAKKSGRKATGARKRP